MNICVIYLCIYVMYNTIKSDNVRIDTYTIIHLQMIKIII